MLPVLGVWLWLQVRQLAQVILQEVGEEDICAEPQAGGLNAPGENGQLSFAQRKNSHIRFVSLFPLPNLVPHLTGKQ